jgi:choline dehydrogenase-like flavoprotein
VAVASDAPPGAGRILTGADVPRDVDERPDVCVVGSGAGGAVVAARLAAQGAKVVVLEEGPWHRPEDSTLREADAYPRLYQEKGQRATADLSIVILQGRSVGGGTTVNWTTSFRTPDRVLRHWRDVHGVEGLSAEVLAPHFAAVEERLQIHEQPADEVNANNGVLWNGAGKLGWDRARTQRNVQGCQNLGYCGMGCPIGARTSMDQSYLPDAVARGARLYANARAVRIEYKERRAVAVHAEVLDPRTELPTGRRVVVRPRAVVLSGGAINTPALLLRSRLDVSGRVGKRTFLHPVSGVFGLYRERIEGWSGAPQSVASHHFADRGPGRVGFFLETVPVHPLFAGVNLGGFGEVHQEIMAGLAHASGLITLSIDGFLPEEKGGEVTLRSDGRVRVDYDVPAPVWEALREGCKALARVHLAAGALAAYSLHDEPVEMRSEAEVARLDQAPWQKLRVVVGTAHQMGGCPMGRDPDRSVVDSRLKMHGMDNIWVVDGSVFPTSLGVNPQLSIFGLAHWAAEQIAPQVR